MLETRKTQLLITMSIQGFIFITCELRTDQMVIINNVVLDVNSLMSIHVTVM